MRKQNPYFHFKQFSVNHANCSMKVGTDGVLLGCWADVGGASRILDIGTGSGVIALMMAQRTPSDAEIHAVEVEPGDARQALENVKNSPWPGKVHIYCSSIQEFTSDTGFDLILSNPPFFINSYAPPDKRRKEARHTSSLSFPELVKAVLKFMMPHGRFNLILPPIEGAIFREFAIQNKLFCSRLWQFRSRKSKPVERWLMEYTLLEQATENGEIIMYDEGNQWTTEFKNLSRDFYLKL